MSWKMPEIFPNLSAAKAIIVDVETRDDRLQEDGPGVRRGAYIIGVAIGTNDGFKKYYPIAHDEGPNLNKSVVLSWVKKELARSHQVKIGTNLLYDLDFLAEKKIEVKGLCYDVQNAEPLLDENRSLYNLNALSQKYLGAEKNEDELKAECDRRGYRGDVRKHLWKLPAKLVGPYAETDVDLPLRIFKKQKKVLEAEELWDLFILETKLIPLLLQMRRQGVRIDVKKLKGTIKEFKLNLKRRKKELDVAAGMSVEYSASSSLAAAFDKAGLLYSLTPKAKQPSFTQAFLKNCGHPIARLTVECRKLDKFIGTFLEGSIENQLVEDHVHCLFNQLRGDEYGTVTGRFSSSHPNLQFIPARDDKFGPLCRSIFIPEKGHDWGKADYTQVEFRIFAHYAMGAGSDDFRKQYNENPDIDYHQQCADLAEISRKDAKNTNFGLIYGMGLTKLAHQLNRSIEEARKFSEKYNERIPFIKSTLAKASDAADKQGYVKTILNRRRRFTLWEPFDWRLAKQIPAIRDKKLMRQTVENEIKRAIDDKREPPRPGIRLAKTYAALNAVIQGSAADLLKKAMVDCHEAGLYNVLLPHLTVHDELDTSVPKTREGKEAFKEQIHIMETAIKFKVPIRVDYKLQKNWGEER